MSNSLNEISKPNDVEGITNDDQWLSVENSVYEEKNIKLGTPDDQNVVSRKQSASDLQSRLKTRKLLGVGELAGDNGDVYKSKISQLLGINESLYVRLPRGMFLWNTLNTLYFLTIGSIVSLQLEYVFFFKIETFSNFAIPTFAAWFEYGIEELTADMILFIRLFGVTVISFGVLFKCTLQQRETRSDIATLLLINVGFHLMLIVVSVLSQGHVIWWSTATRLFFVVGNICYHSFVDGQGGLHRQLIRVIEDFSYMASSPIIEKKPHVEVVDMSANISSTQLEAKKTA